MSASTLVLGLGNILLGDDGIGAWVAESLIRRFEFPENVSVIEGGTLGLDLLPRLHGVERLLLVDAVRLGMAPGAIVRLEGDEVPRALQLKLSPHQVGMMDLLATARLSGCEPGRIVLWGMEPQCLEPGTRFSATIAASAPRLLAEVLGELARWDIVGRPRERSTPRVWWEAPRSERS